MDTTQAAPIAPENPSSAAVKSSLGGPAEIQKRFQAAMASEQEAAAAAESKPEVTESKVDAPKADSILPPDKVVTPKPEPKGSDGMTKEERKDFLAWKERAEASETRLKELEQKLSEKDISSKEITEMKALLEEKENRIKELTPAALMTEIRLDPNYVRSFAEPLNQIGSYLEAVCKENQIDANEMRDAIWNPNQLAGNRAISELLAGLDSMTGTQVQAAIQKARELDAAEKNYLKDPQAAWNAILEDRKAKEGRAKEEERKVLKIAHERIAAEMAKKFDFLSDPAVRESVLKDSVDVDWNSLHPDTKAFYLQAGQAMTHVNPIIKSLKEEIAGLKKALEKNRPPGPASMGARPSSETPKQDAPLGGTVGSRLVEAMRTLG